VNALLIPSVYRVSTAYHKHPLICHYCCHVCVSACLSVTGGVGECNSGTEHPLSLNCLSQTPTDLSLLLPRVCVCLSVRHRRCW